MFTITVVYLDTSAYQGSWWVLGPSTSATSTYVGVLGIYLRKYCNFNYSKKLIVQSGDILI